MNAYEIWMNWTARIFEHPQPYLAWATAVTFVIALALDVFPKHELAKAKSAKAQRTPPVTRR